MQGRQTYRLLPIERNLIGDKQSRSSSAFRALCDPHGREEVLKAWECWDCNLSHLSSERRDTGAGSWAVAIADAPCAPLSQIDQQERKHPGRPGRGGSQAAEPDVVIRSQLRAVASH